MNASILEKIFLFFMVGLFCSSLAYGAQYDLKEMTPEIQQAISNRQSRYDQLQNLKAQGMIGENNQGYVAMVGNDANASAILNTENRDRKVIYQAIAEQNNLGQAGLSTIEKVFAEVQREKTRPGEWVQEPSGNWVKK